MRMKAAVYHRYGGPGDLKIEDAPRPKAGAGKVLVRVHAVSVNMADWIFLTGKPWPIRLMAGGLLRPGGKILGSDVAGVIEEVGEGVTRFKPGDEVFGDLADCGRGGFAEYVEAPQQTLVQKPREVSFIEAAAVPMGAIAALQGLRDHARLKCGESVLIHGASGGVGSSAVQIAKDIGAIVTGVSSTRNLEMVHALGAEHVIDHTSEDFLDSGEKYDVIFGVGGYRSLGDYKQALAEGGRLVLAGGEFRQIFEIMLFGSWHSRGSRKLLNYVAKTNLKDLETIREMLAAGRFKPQIEKTYPLENIVEAMQHFGVEHARSKLVVTIGDG